MKLFHWSEDLFFAELLQTPPKLEEAEVWLHKISKGLAAKKKAGVGGKREEEMGEQAG